MTRYRIFMLLALALALGACGSVSVQDHEARAVIQMLDDLARARELPAEDQLREYRTAQEALEQEAGNVQRLKLAMFLSMPHSPWRDDARALRLLEGVVPGAGVERSPQHDLALLLHDLIAGRQRETSDVRRQLNEELSKSADRQHKLQTQLTERLRQIREEQRKIADLEKKVEALREIDRDTLKRPRK